MTSENSSPGTMTTTGVEAIVGFLDGVGIAYELIEHPKVMSAAAEARVVHVPAEQVAKTVVLHDGSAYAIVAVASCVAFAAVSPASDNRNASCPTASCVSHAQRQTPIVSRQSQRSDLNSMNVLCVTSNFPALNPLILKAA